MGTSGPAQFVITTRRTGRNVEVWQKGEGRDVVFLHGAGGIAAWGPDLEILSQSFRVTVPLFPGFGKSTGIEDIDEVLDAVLHLFDVLGDLRIAKPHLIGHSMGGMLAAEMAAICPNEVGRLALIAPVGLWDDAHPILDFFAVMPQEIAKYVFHDQNHPIAIAMSAIPSPDDEGIVEMYVAYMKGLAAAGRLLWPIPDRGLKKRIGRITAPTFILWGESDKLAPVFYAKEFARLIPGARMRLFREASHMLPLEHPRPLAHAITQFLNDTGVLKAPLKGPVVSEPGGAKTPALKIQKAKPAAPKALSKPAVKSAKPAVSLEKKETAKASPKKKVAAPRKPAPPKKPAPRPKAKPAKKKAKPVAKVKPASKSKPVSKSKAESKSKPTPKKGKAKTVKRR